ncbi:flagellin [Salinadaptatus halalkaliphilus]|uniref:Flagellin n=1 Tax=Salinadaptatus halalkaliphilus TaxID=2419781 RepID=A0A4S3THH6_9EURY|nr:flagellin [Salinadaptatus halalkaliphilus]THE62940.1 flagellin [Salinadaptatus halalkaliphilus]
MGSVSATHLIMFIGSLVIATAVAGTVVVEVGHVSNSIEDRSASVTTEIETEIAIISDESQTDAIVSEDGQGNLDTITVLVKNIGSEDIPADPSAVDATVDGSYTTVDTVSHVEEDDARTWEPGGVTEIDLAIADEQEPSGDIDVTIIVSGNEDTMTFYYPE